MKCASCVKQWHVRRLYKLAQIGIYDDDLLLEVGWGFYARCEDILIVNRAVDGEVPCPACCHIVYRLKYYRNLKLAHKESPLKKNLSCLHCEQIFSWHDIRQSLRNHPKCFDCHTSLEWRYMKNSLSCNNCNKEWSWQQYRQSIKHRIWLPCPHCGKVVSRPKQEMIHQETIHSNVRNETAFLWGDLICPRCKYIGVHMEGKYQCFRCGYNITWHNYIKRLKRRNEYLHCEKCGHKFSWSSWRNQYQVCGSLTTGNPAPIKTFFTEWPKCKTPQEQIIQIDNLIHALHDRGTLAPLFIEGDRTKVIAFLDELAQA